MQALTCVKHRGKEGGCGKSMGKHIKIPPHLYLDNIAVRLLGGSELYNVPLGGITMEHRRRAIAILERFRVVALFDDLQDPAQMFQSLGWPDLELTKINPSEHPDPQLSREELAEMESLVQHDSAVYQHFMDMAPEERMQPVSESA